uniref:SGNH hydrolase-type esterase domain-containing protein n=1 Tax=mine drainage metagenome TaxID=410659 RepID=E6Q5X2_9ZZZZ
MAKDFLAGTSVLLLLVLAACSGPSSAQGLLPAVAPSATPGSIAFVGDSITAGVMLPGGGGTLNPTRDSPSAFPYIVGRALGAQVYDLGIGGETIGQAIGAELPNIPTSASTVVVYLGTNNIFGVTSLSTTSLAISEESQLMTDIRARMPKACVLIVALPYPILSNTFINAQVDAFDSALATKNHLVLDLRQEQWTTEASNYYPGGIHPNPIGNADLAQNVESSLLAGHCL